MECFIPQRRGFSSFPPALALATKGPDTYLISCGLDPASQMGLWSGTGHCIHAQAGTESPRKEDVELGQEVPPEVIQRMSCNYKSQVQTLLKRQELV